MEHPGAIDEVDGDASASVDDDGGIACGCIGAQAREKAIMADGCVVVERSGHRDRGVATEAKDAISAEAFGQNVFDFGSGNEIYGGDKGRGGVFVGHEGIDSASEFGGLIVSDADCAMGGKALHSSKSGSGIADGDCEQGDGVGFGEGWACGHHGGRVRVAHARLDRATTVGKWVLARLILRFKGRPSMGLCFRWACTRWRR